MEKIYNRINWEDIPSTNTPLNAENLNKMDSALDEIDGRIVGMNGDLPTWDANVNYTAGTSFVYWNQTIWECKLNCIGIEPSSSTSNYWRAIDFATLSQRINTLNTDLTNKSIKHATETFTTNAYGWINFPYNRLVTMARLTNSAYDYNHLSLEPVTSQHITMSKAFFQSTYNTFAVAKVLSANTAYEVEYWYYDMGYVNA